MKSMLIVRTFPLPHLTPSPSFPLPPWLEQDGPTRKAGLRQWATYRPQILSYAAQRNYVDNENSHVSRLSPWLNCGLLTEAEISRDALQSHPFSRIEKFLQEVYWRQYWRGYLANRPTLWTAYEASLPTLSSPAYSSFIKDLEAGHARVAIMGYFAQQLVQTGYLHNHARMWFAAWWIHVEKQPWQQGAEFFLRHLIDGDPAVNTLSWRWVAGLHTNGKSYLARRSNLRKYLSPALLSQYAEGLENLDGVEPRPPSPTEATPPLSKDSHLAGLCPLPSPAPAVQTLCFYLENLDLQGLFTLLKSSSLQPTTFHLLTDSKVEERYSPQKRNWRLKAAAALVTQLREQGYQSSLIDLCVPEQSSLLPTGEPILIAQPAIGPYTPSYQQIRQTHPQAAPLSDPQTAALHSTATAGFFSFWKKAKATLAF